ncbi:hypothetical protein L1987_73723 [Smallanthus sonchifolius]|uniref:Uncharacterized protein n=1 Tax=Smallanthus sonchifolius TaxID=185202 RepID=A0ACB9A0C6_9ASTR|nr:hypothetical protein L1987_73723 [Smallanthus sonchifolius]
MITQINLSLSIINPPLLLNPASQSRDLVAPSNQKSYHRPRRQDDNGIAGHRRNLAEITLRWCPAGAGDFNILLTRGVSSFIPG